MDESSGQVGWTSRVDESGGQVGWASQGGGARGGGPMSTSFGLKNCTALFVKLSYVLFKLVKPKMLPMKVKYGEIEGMLC